MSDVQADIDNLLATYGEASVELEEWELPYFDAMVAMEDGRRFLVRGDQRDVRRGMEATAAVASDSVAAQLLQLTAIAWAYLTRTAALDLSWAQFRDRCVFVQPRSKPATVDPTGTGGAP